ncbi:MAG: hypothetical protein WCV50_06240 [Patescibacteria group bacterium]
MDKPEQNPQPPQSAQSLEMLKPNEGKDIEKPKKGHSLRNFLITIIIILIVILVGLSVTGLYKVPVLSAIIKTGQPKDLGIKTSDQAYASIKEKIPMTISGGTIDYSSPADQIFSGQIDIDTTTTSEEVTSWLKRFQGSDQIFSDVQVKKIEGGMEISCLVNKYIKAPVYVKVMVDRTSEKSVALNIINAKAGMFNVPDKYLTQAEDFFQKKVNEIMAAVPGFSMEKYELHDGYSAFKGTWPANVRPTAGGWNSLIKI